MKFSIIVPIYNIERYIEECVESILNQSFSDFEIILVDDGSTDASASIIDKYNQEKNVKIIHKKNGGLSDARNAGIREAQGDYLMFVDGDDYLASKYCLSAIAEEIYSHHADIVQYKKVYLYDNGKIRREGDIEGTFYDNPIDGLSDLNKKGLVSVSACDKVIRSELIKKNDLFFKEGLTCEDLFWSYKLYFHISSISVLNNDVYVYRQGRTGSISSTKSVNNCTDLFSIIQFWKNYDYENEEIRLLYLNMISYWYLIYRTLYHRNCYGDNKNLLSKELDGFFLKYHENFKVKKAYNLSKIVGCNITFSVLRVYQKLKAAGIMRIKNG